MLDLSNNFELNLSSGMILPLCLENYFFQLLTTWDSATNSESYAERESI